MARFHVTRPCGLLLLVFALAALKVPGQADEVVVRAIGATVVAEDFDGDQFEWGPLNNARGTLIALLLTVGEDDPRSIVGVDAQASDLALMTDSTGRDLKQPLPKETGDDDGFSSMNQAAGFDPFAKMSSDNKQAVVEVNAPRSPAKQAESITVEGTLQVSVASGQDTSVIKAVKLEEAPLALAGHSVKIIAVGEQEWFDEKTRQITFEFKGASAESFAGMRLLGPAGDALDGEINSTMSFGQTLQATFSLKDLAVDKVDVELSFWKGFEQLGVPIEVTIPVGGF